MTDIYLYGEIGYEVTAKDVAATLQDLSGEIRVHFHSPGGSLYEAMAIHGLIRSYQENKGQVTGYVEGVVASAMAYVTTAIPKGSLFIDSQAWMMVHLALSGAYGTPEEIRKQADITERQTETMIKAFADRTGKKEGDVKTLLADDYWMDADLALQEGFVDSIVQSEKIAAELDDAYITKYGYNADKVPQQIITSKSTSMDQLKDILGIQASDEKSVAKAVRAVLDERDNLKAQINTKNETISTLTEKSNGLQDTVAQKDKELGKLKEKIQDSEKKDLKAQVVREAKVQLPDEQVQALDRRIEMYFNSPEEYQDDIRADMVTFARAVGVPEGKELAGTKTRDDEEPETGHITDYERRLTKETEKLVATGIGWDEAYAKAKQTITS